jgi:hypothetical protein
LAKSPFDPILRHAVKLDPGERAITSLREREGELAPEGDSVDVVLVPEGGGSLRS